MRLIIQIPCYNEEHTLPATLRDLPKSIPGIDSIEYMVVDDGSTDRTVKVAKELGVHHILSEPHKGLAATFRKGIRSSLTLGADIIVNTDGDNQYVGEDIEKLVRPIVEGRADIMIGCRNIENIPHFSPIKKKLQRFGSWVVRRVSNTTVSDTTSGFRAYNRQAALSLNIFNNYTYTLETIIQAGYKGFRIRSEDIRVNGVLRPSRLIKSNIQYIMKSMWIIFCIFMIYKPFQFFSIISSVLVASGMALGLRWIYIAFLHHSSTDHTASLILATILLVTGFQALLFGFTAYLNSINRNLLEELVVENRKKKF